MQELTLFGGLARMQIPQEIEIGVSQNLGFASYSIMKDCLPKIEGAKSVRILSYEFYPEAWYDNRVKGKMLYDIQNMEETLHKYKQNAKISEAYLKLIYLEKKKDEWQELWDQIIEVDDINDLTSVVERCIENLSNNEGKFELEIRYQDEGYYYDSSSGDSAWLKYTMRLMTRRCLQIWRKLNNAQIIRGLALQQRGLYYMNGSIGSLDSEKAIQKQGKGADGCGHKQLVVVAQTREWWEVPTLPMQLLLTTPGADDPWVVMDINSLKPYRSKLLPDRGVEAAKRRAREWKKQGLFSSDKS